MADIRLRPFRPQTVPLAVCCLWLTDATPPRLHRTELHSTNLNERLNKEIKRRADVVGIFPDDASILRPVGAVLFEQDDPAGLWPQQDGRGLGPA